MKPTMRFLLGLVGMLAVGVTVDLVAGIVAMIICAPFVIVADLVRAQRARALGSA
jgi:hypothetical protein